MSGPVIDRVFKFNGAGCLAKQPPHWYCDCCGATLSAWAATDTEGKVWGKTCLARARGKVAYKAAFWTEAEKAAAWAARCFPVGTTVHTHSVETGNTGIFVVVDAAEVVILGANVLACPRPFAQVKVRNEKGGKEKVICAKWLYCNAYKVIYSDGRTGDKYDGFAPV